MALPYVYDGDKIQSQYNRFKQSFSSVEKLKIHYAVKALSNISILSFIKKLGAGIDCVSLEEIRLGLLAGFSPKDIIYTPNGVSFEEYKKAMILGVKITVDNISILEKLGIEFNDYPIFLRLNPHIMAGGNTNISVGHIDSKFGISIHQLPIVKRLIKHYSI